MICRKGHLSSLLEQKELIRLLEMMFAAAQKEEHHPFHSLEEGSQTDDEKEKESEPEVEKAMSTPSITFTPATVFLWNSDLLLLKNGVPVVRSFAFPHEIVPHCYGCTRRYGQWLPLSSMTTNDCSPFYSFFFLFLSFSLLFSYWQMCLNAFKRRKEPQKHSFERLIADVPAQQIN